MDNIIFHHKQIDNSYSIEMKIMKVKEDKFRHEGIFYRLVVIDRKTGKRLLGFDNSERKGHHIYKGNRELKYDFIDEWRLIKDFMKEYEKLKEKLK